MQLVRLIYSSQLTPDTAPQELAKIHHTALSNNPRVGITGTLVFGDDQFIQYIEGGRAEVNHLFNLIQSDKRHQDILLIDFAEITEREFEAWHMKLVLLTEANAKLLRFTGKGTFEPSKMNANTALAFFRQFRSSKEA
jgi:hypothetical protein